MTSRPRPGPAIVTLTALTALSMIGPGAWMWIAPDSFAAFAGWPSHAHFLHDAGAFQMGIGLMLLAALRFHHALVVVLGGFLFANTLHAYNHLKHLEMGGSATDPIVLGTFTVLATIALGLRLRQLRTGVAHQGTT